MEFLWKGLLVFIGLNVISAIYGVCIGAGWNFQKHKRVRCKYPDHKMLNRIASEIKIHGGRDWED